MSCSASQQAEGRQVDSVHLPKVSVDPGVTGCLDGHGILVGHIDHPLIRDPILQQLKEVLQLSEVLQQLQSFQLLTAVSCVFAPRRVIALVQDPYVRSVEVGLELFELGTSIACLDAVSGEGSDHDFVDSVRRNRSRVAGLEIEA